MPNLSDVAKRAHVSISTVSAVLRGKHTTVGITELCAMRVRQAAQEVGYVPNYHARSMRLGRAHVVGVAMQLPGVSETGSLYFNGICGGVHAAIQDEGYNLMLIRNAGRTGAVDRGVMGLRQRMLDGLIIPGRASNLRDGQTLAEPDMRELLVVVLDPPFQTDLPSVALDEVAGVALAVQHLAELGHRRVLWLGPDQWGDSPTTGREQAFITAAWDAALQGASIRYADRRSSDRLANAAQAAQAALSERLTQDPDFTAIVGYNDVVAIGAMQALQQAGLQVPQDVSVVGFDDGPLAQLIAPPLTTVSHRLSDIGLQAGRLVLELITDAQARRRPRGQRLVVSPTLSVRHSTGPARPR